MWGMGSLCSDRGRLRLHRLGILGDAGKLGGADIETGGDATRISDAKEGEGDIADGARDTGLCVVAGCMVGTQRDAK
jgi:hypothetical protein